jgi:endonuclease YncB( thermonuclease family)
MFRGIVALVVAAFALASRGVGQDKPQASTATTDRVKGSINHGGGKDEWNWIRGRVKVVNATTLEFDDGTRIPLGIAAPEPDQQGRIAGRLYPCGREAADFLRRLIGDQSVTCIGTVEGDVCLGCYVGDTNVSHAMVVNGWAVATHSSLHPAEIIARENKRGLWRGEFVNPVEWKNGKRLPGER